MAKIQISILCLALATSVMAARKAEPNPMSGKSVAQLREVLQSEAPEMDRANAALALGEKVTPPATEKGKKGKKDKKGQKTPEWELKVSDGFVDTCAIGLKDRAGSVRFYSGKALVPVGADALGALTKAAACDNDDTRISAIHAVGMMAKSMAGKKGGPQVDLAPVFGSAVPVLRKALKDKNYIVRETACGTFARLGTAGAPAIDDLIALLDDKQFCVVNQAVHAVAAVDPGGDKSVPALVKALESEHDVREFIVKELGAMGQRAKDAVPALSKLAGEDKNSWHVALQSTKALLTIVTYRDKPEKDAVVAQRKQALGAIARVVAGQDAIFLQARIRNTLLDHKGYCPIGAEIEPMMPWLEKTLRQWAKVQRGHYGPPRDLLCAFAARIGQNYKKDHLIAIAKELKAAKDTNKDALKDLDIILKLEDK